MSSGIEKFFPLGVVYMSYEPYRLQDMGGERAIRILEGILAQLSITEVSEMTTMELSILRAIAENPPADLPRRGVEDRLTSS